VQRIAGTHHPPGRRQPTEYSTKSSLIIEILDLTNRIEPFLPPSNFHPVFQSILDLGWSVKRPQLTEAGQQGGHKKSI
jgi:hypothetical protein